MHAVELLGISKLFKTVRSQDFLAVDNINLQIFDKEFFSLLGPSGCGKTTTLRMIAGFEMPTAGEIHIHGEAMQNRLPFHRPVNTVFQNYALFPHMTIAQNVAFGLEMENLSKQVIRDRVAEMLKLVQLTDVAKRYPRQLSGGQQQRVALARALVKRPSVLLLDEPLGALDLKLRKEMQLELKKMQRILGITFIYVTHDQEEALTMSDRIAVMDGGKLQQVGTPVEIYEYPQTRFVAEFIGDSNFLTGRVVERQSGKITVLVDQQLPVLVDTTDDLPAGKVVTLVLRPEKVGIYPADDEAENTWPGTVQEVVYIGTDTRYTVQLTAKSSIAIRRQNLHRDDLQRHKVGDRVQVSVPPESICIF
ncbi:ABC transporter ATP-binding protein [Tychonema sp. BBK16]|uniref:ABC transporter ATP-binding protein n=1 Tax=Tychonema sp. BBK16 TaxID=2699888 RepID=UPI001F28B0D6|nr:ABC transporter ATP-binding protein [Tychonema sp. BBK16]MCF6374747.1 ABC transporter ATP-binding protein [Tychonema sp. BBK16]